MVDSRLVAIAALVFASAASSARADDKARTAAAKQLFTKQTEKPGSEDLGAFYAGASTAWFPGHGVGKTGEAGGDQMMWAMGPPYIGKIAAQKMAVGWSGTWGWMAVDVVITQTPYSDSSGHQKGPEKHRYHWLSVIVADGKQVKTKALLLADTRADKKLVAGPAAKPATSLGPLAALTAAPVTVAAQLAKDANVAVFGTSEGEVGLGAVAAKKLLASWNSLKLTVVGTPHETIVGDLGFAFTELDLELAGKPVRLRAMLVARKTTAGAWEVVALQYGADSEFGDPPRP